MEALMTLLTKLGMLLFVVGVLGVTVASWMLIIKAFRESLLWGVACVLFPIASFLFVMRYWAETRKVVVGYLLMLAVTVAGVGLLWLDQGVREQVAGAVRSHGGAGADAEEAAGAKASGLAQKEQELERQEREQRRRAEVQQRAKELYLFVSQWREELQARQPGETASAVERERFREEHQNYTGLLNEYKRTVKELEQLQ